MGKTISFRDNILFYNVYILFDYSFMSTGKSIFTLYFEFSSFWHISTEVCLQTHSFAWLFCCNKGKELSRWAAPELSRWVDHSNYQLFILSQMHVLHTEQQKISFGQIPYFDFQVLTRWQMERNYNQKKAAHLSQPKTIFRLSKLEASPPCFPQMSPAERFYREEIRKTSGAAMEIVLTHSNLNHNFFTVAYLQFLWNLGKYIFIFLSSQLGSIFGQAFTRVKANY